MEFFWGKRQIVRWMSSLTGYFDVKCSVPPNDGGLSGPKDGDLCAGNKINSCKNDQIIDASVK